MSLRRSVVALCLGASISSVLAATGGSFADGGDTLVSALLVRDIYFFPFITPHLLSNSLPIYVDVFGKR